MQLTHDLVDVAAQVRVGVDIALVVQAQDRQGAVDREDVECADEIKVPNDLFVVKNSHEVEAVSVLLFEDLGIHHLAHAVEDVLMAVAAVGVEIQCKLAGSHQHNLVRADEVDRLHQALTHLPA